MNDFFATLKNLLSGKRGRLILLLFIVGAVLLTFSFAVGGEGEQKISEQGQTLAEYKAELESSLADFCSSVAGVGRCRVMVSFSEGESLEYKGSSLIGSSPPKVLGVTVLCKGGSSARVKAELSEMLSALFDIGENRICVLKLS